MILSSSLDRIFFCLIWKMSDLQNAGKMLKKSPGAMMILSVAALAASTSGGRAAPCLAVLGAPQSIAAQMHRQPTVASVAAAEQRLATVAYGLTRRTHASRKAD
jgi:hypothetical protein